MIEFRNITVKYKDKLVFDHFNLKINNGDKVLLYGKSGTGKSSILKLLLGFIQPETGEVLIDDSPLDKKSVWQLRRQTAFVNQNLEIGEGSIRKYFQEFFNLGCNSCISYDEEKILKLFEFFELPDDYLDKEIEELSGGEKQRIAIISSLLIDREIYLLDEITSALDTEMKQKVAKFFAKDFDKTLLIVSHDEIWKEFENIQVVNLNGAAHAKS